MNGHKPLWLLYAVPMILGWGYYLLVFWPGILTPDSNDQILQALSGTYFDTHPVFHTFLIGLLFRLTHTIVSITFAQVILLAISIGYGLMRLQNIGVDQRIIWVACAFSALSPVNATMSISVWKDIPFGIAILWVTIFAFEIVVSEGRWLSKPCSLFFLFLVMFFSALLRHNGLIVPIGVLVAGGILLPRQRIRWLFLLVSYVLSMILLSGPVFSALGVKKAGPYFSSLYELFHIAAHLNAGTTFFPNEIEVLNQIRPVSSVWNYQCNSIDTMIYDPAFQAKSAFLYSREIQRIFFATLFRNPLVNLKHVICSSSLVWKVTDPYEPFHTFGLFKDKRGKWETISPESNPYGWRMESRLPNRVEPTAEFLQSTLEPKVVWFLWRPAIYLYMLIFGAIRLGLIFKKRTPFLIIIPALMVSLSIVLVNGSQDFRYMYPVYLAFCFLWPFLYWGRPVNPALPNVENVGENPSTPNPQEIALLRL